MSKIPPPVDVHYAYGRRNAALEAVMRVGAVKRWHMIETTKTQTLAEHSCNVAMLVWVLVVTAPGIYFGPPKECVVDALFHDIPEVFLGDIPTHTKPWLDGGGLEMAEQSITPRALQFNPLAPLKRLIKICDLADGIRFIRLHGVDGTASHAMIGLEAQLEKHYLAAHSEWPGAIWSHIYNETQFYAYEARIKAAPRFGDGDEAPLADDVARGS